MVRDQAGRPLAELSGGQRQRVWVAMALAQDTYLLLLDEPTTFLDINHQIELLDLLTDLNRQRGTTIVIVLHDLNPACRYADQVIAMKDGSIVVEGPPAEVISSAVVTEAFGLDCAVARAVVCADSGPTPRVEPLPQASCCRHPQAIAAIGCWVLTSLVRSSARTNRTP